MESGRKKRKMGNGEENDDDEKEEQVEEEEEEKIEKFFALIRSTREMRDHLRNRPNGSKEEEDEGKQKQVAAVWNPTFQPEDFIEDSKFKKPSVANDSPAAGPSSKTQHEQEKEAKKGEEDCSLDLKLSL